MIFTSYLNIIKIRGDFILRIIKCNGEKLLLKELKGCFNFFNKEINLDKQTRGYGLIRDKSVIHKDIASVASVGYYKSNGIFL